MLLSAASRSTCGLPTRKDFLSEHKMGPYSTIARYHCVWATYVCMRFCGWRRAAKQAVLFTTSVQYNAIQRNTRLLCRCSLAHSLSLCVFLSCGRPGLHGDADHRHHSVLGFRGVVSPRLLPPLGERLFLGPEPGVCWGCSHGGIRPVSAHSGGAGWDVEAGAP